MMGASDTKPDTYFAGVRVDWIDELPEDPGAAFLELGCGLGGTGAYARSRKKCTRYVGMEQDSSAAIKAQGELTEMLVGDVELMELSPEPASLDGLLMSEDLEHLADPWEVLRKLLVFVKPGGRIDASSPNVAHSAIVRQLIKGRWDLTWQGGRTGPIYAGSRRHPIERC